MSPSARRGIERSGNGRSGHLPTASERGQGTLELLLVLLVLVPLFFGGIELARGISIRHALDSGVGIAVRALSLDPGQWTWAESTVQQAVSDNVMGGGSASAPTLLAYDANGSSLSPGVLSALPFGAAFRLEAVVTYTPDIPLAADQAIVIRVSHWGIVERYP